jgi:murein L,D-transpeptidase YcbB/YkuD
MALVSLTLSGDADEEREELETKIADGDTLRIPLERPMPIYLVYWTAIPQDDGTVGFRTDLYGRDKRLSGLFGGRTS